VNFNLLKSVRSHFDEIRFGLIIPNVLRISPVEEVKVQVNGHWV
jgi:hypothetical protein